MSPHKGLGGRAGIGLRDPSVGESLGFERRHGREEVFRDGTMVAAYRMKTKLGLGWEGMWHQTEDARGAPEK